MNVLKSSIFNLVGGLIPAAAAIFTVPVLIRELGEVNYGIFALITSVVGYFALLDINATAGSVKFVAQYHATSESEHLSEVISFGALIYSVIGLLGGFGIYMTAEYMVGHAFNVPTSIAPEATSALQFGALAFLFGQAQVYLQSVVQALRRYDISSRFEAIFGTAASLITVAVAIGGGGLTGIIIARLAVSIVNVTVLVHRIRLLLPNLRLKFPRKEVRNNVASFSAFAYLSRLAAISSNHSDKLLIGAIGDMRGLALYAVPFMLANRVFGLVFRLAAVIFPFISALSAKNDVEQVRGLYIDGSRYIFLLNASLFFLVVGMAPEIMHYWAGDAFRDDSRKVLVLASAAIMIDSLTNVPSLVNDGLGRPAITGASAIVRAIVSVAAVYFALKNWGIVGAAFAQLLVSVLASAAFLYVVHWQTIKVKLGEVLFQAYLPGIGLLAMGLGLIPWTLSRAPFTPSQSIGWFIVLLAFACGYTSKIGVRIEHRQRFTAVWRRTVVKNRV